VFLRRDKAWQYAGYEALRVSFIPEPASAALLALGASLMIRSRRRVA
jgi:hypothetical protein